MRQSGESAVRSVVSQVPEEGAREGRVMTLTIDVIRALFLDHRHRGTLISFLEQRTTRFDPDFVKKGERRGKKKKEKGRRKIECLIASLDKARSFSTSILCSFLIRCRSLGEKIARSIDVTSVSNIVNRSGAREKG